MVDAITCRFGREELRGRLHQVDLIAADIDECLFPGLSQVVLGRLIFHHIITRPLRPQDRRFVPQLIRGWAYIQRVKLARAAGTSPTNEALMRRYEGSMTKIPEAYFLSAVQGIPSRSFTGVRRTLKLLGQRAKLVLISFGIHLVAEAYRRQLNRAAAAPYVVFTEANRIAFAEGPDGRRVFAGYVPPLWTEPRHKRQRLEAHLRIHNACRPLVLGNSREEVEMATLARELGGLSVGINPTPEAAPCFDLLLRAPDWRPLLALFSALLSELAE